MMSKIQLLPSGIPLVDSAWGGLYRGGTYFLIGPHKSGRTLLALQFALECAQQKEICLFFTSMRPKDLMIHAVSIDFDLQHYMNQNLIIVVRISPPVDLEEVEDPDYYLADYIRDILPVVKQYQPNKIVFDELTPFINFKNTKILHDAFLQTIETIEDAAVTTLLTLGEPANPASRNIVELLTSSSTGKIELVKQVDAANKYYTGTLTIIPNIGHTEGKFSSIYHIEPHKGIIVESIPSVNEKISFNNISTEIQSKQYKAFSEIDIPANITNLSNVYSLNDFKLILNNQIAQYKITGQLFVLVAIRLDAEAERRNLLTLNQLQNTIILSIDKKDKICTIGDRVLVLITRESMDAVIKLISKIKLNLPNNDPTYIHTVTRLLSIYAVHVDPDIVNAEGMIGLLIKNNLTAKEKSGYVQ